MTNTTLAQRFLSTDRASRMLLAQRVALGAVMLPHGAQKLLGWLGGYGFSATMEFLTGSMGLPAPLAFLVIAAESFGALALMLGLATRVAALGIASVMIGAVVTSHLSNGFFMNWLGNQSGEGFEYHLLALSLALPLVFAGGGRFALDSWIADGLSRRSAMPALVVAMLAVAVTTATVPARAEGARADVEIAALPTSDGSVLGALGASGDASPIPTARSRPAAG